jgi:hypothetical protein
VLPKKRCEQYMKTKFPTLDDGQMVGTSQWIINKHVKLVKIWWHFEKHHFQMMNGKRTFYTAFVSITQQSK